MKSEHAIAQQEQRNSAHVEIFGVGVQGTQTTPSTLQKKIETTEAPRITCKLSWTFLSEFLWIFGVNSYGYLWRVLVDTFLHFFSDFSCPSKLKKQFQFSYTLKWQCGVKL